MKYKTFQLSIAKRDNTSSYICTDGLPQHQAELDTPFSKYMFIFHLSHW